MPRGDQWKYLTFINGIFQFLNLDFKSYSAKREAKLKFIEANKVLVYQCGTDMVA